ncbi:hypothetical protein DYD21_00800 [Rhodohalobacter sp. SW132]|uniref:hypothetical protein n=1 Tax=Rhodohalobacter sp. SW132 TaxID=2293433 RepID=UPI000E23CAC5|nr:hypothetical protein [Rhodohalobacter sp. SW132]REL38519.1 hypothetical protein DYD21_00800 [Rhodohalobacter sp. SW132]
MLLRGLFFALIFFLLYRYLSKKLSSFNTPRQNNRPGGAHSQRSGSSSQNGRRRKNLEHIEEAEFEDITEKEKK